MRNRYYNPEIKRFMNRDVIVGNIEDSQTLNRYAYVNGNPITYNDPFGLARESIVGSSWLSNIQTTLDIAGMVPGLGIFPDVLNASIYLSTGNYEEALWSGIGAIPIVGDATSGVRNVNKLSKAVSGSNYKKYKRIPKTKGRWDGEPGNSNWYSEREEVIKITRGEPIEFKDGRPDFSPWNKQTIKFRKGELDGSPNDFAKVHKRLKGELGFRTQTEAQEWMKKERLTAHHEVIETIQLVPSDLNNKIPHIGGASDLRGGK